MLAVVQPPSSVRNAPIRTSPAGKTRNSAAYRKNGSAPSQASLYRRRAGPTGPGTVISSTRSATAVDSLLSQHLRAPLRGEHGAGLGDLIDGRELDRLVVLRRRELREQVLRHDAALAHVLEARRVRVALEEQHLAGVRVDELLPQPCGVRVRGVLVDRLAVVAAVDAVGGHGDGDVDLAL